jgi:transposase
MDTGGSERMIIEVEIYEKIRYYHVHEELSQRAIAKRLGISRTTVKKYIDGNQVPWERSGVSGRTPYIVTSDIEEIIKSYLEEDNTENIKKQKHTARRIHERLVVEHSFSGAESTIRPIVSRLKQKTAKAFVPLSYDYAEAIQIDWGEAYYYLNGKKNKINLFCMRQCHSADIFVIAFMRQNEESFLEGLSAGLSHFGGTPRKIIFDNAKVAVKEGFGTHAKAQDYYRAFAAHYAFKTEFCNIAAGHEKGLVENLVGYIRRNVMVPLPRVSDLDELNKSLLEKCFNYRKHKIQGRQLTVGEMFDLEATYLIPLPKYVYDTSKSTTSKVDEFALVRFDRSKYSVPHRFAGKTVSVKGSGNYILVLYENVEIARYPRSYTRDSVHYKIEHYIDLIEKRPRSAYNAKPVKAQLDPAIMNYGQSLENPKDMVKLLRLCVDHGQDKVLRAINASGSHTKPSIGLISTHLSCVPAITPVVIESEIKVASVGLKKYDALIAGGMVACI